MASLTLKHIHKVYDGGVRAVSDLNLQIDDKDFVVFVGPSGCGKSTTLRMIAGLETITAGELDIDGKVVNDLPPKDRDIAMVFQNYALYPHKTVYENMAFGLRLAKLDKDEIDRRIKAAAEVLGLTPYLSRKPKALSGGQRQRVALGRAIVREPKVFLLDEPLSNLDAKLRVQMRSEITKLHRRLGTTFIYVTHDQTEAMTMGSKIVVMKDGVMQQVDTPTRLYDHPSNVFVATFLGTPQMNLFDCRIVEENGTYYGLITKGSSAFKIKIHDKTIRELIDLDYIGKEVILGLRPEEIYQVDSADGAESIPVVIDVIEKLGSELVAYCQIEGTEIPIVAKLDGRKELREGDRLTVTFHTTHLHLFDKDSKRRIAALVGENFVVIRLNGKDGAYTLGEETVKLDGDKLSRLLPSFRGENDVFLRIPANAFGLECKEGSLKLKATIQSVEGEKGSRFMYFSIPGLKTYLTADLPLLEAKPGDQVDLYLDPTLCELYDKKLNNRLIAAYPFTSNSCIADVRKDKDGACYAKFGGYCLKLEGDYEPGHYELTIPFDAFTLLKRVGRFGRLEGLDKQDSMKFKCVNESLLGENAVLYANLPEFPDYVCVLCPGYASCFDSKSACFNIDASKLVLRKAEKQ